ncbi:Poly [ADP-ribose] polymerase 3 [Cladochytrium tenue]|nr:Poly [ADP-ribose] polymerase 3 [Cladochytrium tenue]
MTVAALRATLDGLVATGRCPPPADAAAAAAKAARRKADLVALLEAWLAAEPPSTTTAAADAAVTAAAVASDAPTASSDSLPGAPTIAVEDVPAMKVADLRAALVGLGLAVDGKKKDLVDRLVGALQAQESGNKAAPPANGAGDAAPPAAKGRAKRKSAPEDGDGGATTVAATPATIAAPAVVAKKPKIAVDEFCSLPGATVFETNIGANNNKYYKIHLVQGTVGNFAVFTRVGERGMFDTYMASNLDDAKKAFKKKFKDKTANDWDKRDTFTAKAGKYTMIEMDYSSDTDEPDTAKPATAGAAKPAPSAPAKCTLPETLQFLLQLIFDPMMFTAAMGNLGVDTEKLPLGKLSKGQIRAGFEVLEQLQAELDGKRPDAGLPPVIGTLAMLQTKIDLLNTLGDIEIAQKLQKTPEETDALTRNYDSLKNTITPVDPGSAEFAWISEYTRASHGGPRTRVSVLHAYRIDRQGERDRADEFARLKNRKLLWHGTNIAVVAAILSSGLRIMPHSGGRVGRGIYFASENSKSYGYTGFSGSLGCMFLNEVVLGNEHTITRDDSSLRRAPAGFDCVVARGQTEPDAARDIQIDGEWGPVTVPLGPPVPRPEFAKSSFSQSEYLVYSEVSRVYEDGKRG